MTRVSEPLLREHRKIAPEVEKIRALADSVGEIPAAELRRGVDEATRFLLRDLMPHAQAEEAGLYQVAGIVLGSPDAMAGMSRDHVEIGRLSDELGLVRDRLHHGREVDPRELRRLLYGLHAVITLHLAKEEEIYLPLLDEHLTEEESASMFDLMEEAERFARSGGRARSR